MLCLEKDKAYLFLYVVTSYKNKVDNTVFKAEEVTPQLREELGDNLSIETLQIKIPFFVKKISIGKIGCFIEDYAEDIKSDLPYRNKNGEIDMSVYEVDYEFSMPYAPFFDMSDPINSFEVIKSHQVSGEILSELDEWEEHLHTMITNRVSTLPSMRA